MESRSVLGIVKPRARILKKENQKDRSGRALFPAPSSDSPRCKTPRGTASHTYDASEIDTQTTYPDGSTVDYIYDAPNRLTTVTFGADTASYAYDASGKLTSFTHFNGVETTYTYDTANRLTSVSSSVASYAFTLDAAGNRTHVLRNEPLECQLAQGSTVYEYNALKNRLQSAGTTAYACDDEGQLTTAGTTTMTFDDAHRLIGIGSGTQFTYDGAGKRLKAVRSGVETRYIYDPFGNLMAEADATGQITRKYIYGAGLLAVETAASGTFFYHFDATGHTIALTDLDQNIVNAYAYEPFGQILNQQETVPQPFKFVGKFGVMAEDGGLYYMRARYYDSSTGRFISEDPIGFAGGDVNLYAYVRNRPVNAIDPYGLSGYLTIYSSGLGDGSSGTGGISGHSWISYTPDGGRTTTYGTWGNNPFGLGNGLHSDLEFGRPADASRTTYLDDQQEADLYATIEAYKQKGADAWAYSAPCSTFASDAWFRTTGEYLHPLDLYSNLSVLKDSIVNANNGYIPSWYLNLWVGP